MRLFNNIENIKNFDIDPNWWNNRKKGISCYFRIKNEEEFIVPSILSIIDYVDEVIIALQPSVDNTEQLIKSINNPKIKIYDYPFTLIGNGPDYPKQNPASVYCQTYYYNWTLSKTNYDWCVKWDGDMVALPIIEQYIKPDIDRQFFGFDIVKIEHNGQWWLSKQHPISNSAPSGLFKVRQNLEYVNGRQTHVFKKKPGKRTMGCYVHLKWCKKHFDDVWDKNWRDIPKWRKLCERAIPGKIYQNEKPEILLSRINSNMGLML